MLRKSLQTVDKVAEEVIEHPIRNAKIMAGVAVTCIALEKMTDKLFTKLDERQQAKQYGEAAVLPLVETEESHDEA